jgi:hypothetical protein
MQSKVSHTVKMYWEALLPPAITGPEPRVALVNPLVLGSQTPELAPGGRVDEYGRRRGTEQAHDHALVGTAELSPLADPVRELFDDYEEPREDAQLVARRMLRQLPTLERLVVRFRFGIDGTSPLSQRDVAARLGISRRTAQSLEYRALEKLKQMAGVGHDGPDLLETGEVRELVRSAKGGTSSERAA